MFERLREYQGIGAMLVEYRLEKQGYSEFRLHVHVCCCQMILLVTGLFMTDNPGLR
jgi:hypothetical protein